MHVYIGHKNCKFVLLLSIPVTVISGPNLIKTSLIISLDILHAFNNDVAEFVLITSAN